ncbi:shikimate dehydrogenase [Bowmanella denitrificans]|uniref:shikimate dehydrogenase n=1 Tax=Bowmanella denitrificans TaxID=366582 RepID=UPI000C99972B|nr:shikimate dehydrogenase [Bowmanella denitrificans]
MDQYAVFGNPIAHSKSPFIHKMFAEQTGQSLHYAAILSPLDGFAESVSTFIASGGRGANVTVPFKEQAFKLVEQLSPAARQAGAVNTLIYQDGKLLGDNTDGIGLVKDLLFHGVVLQGKKILIIGAGGATRGVVLPILEQTPASLHIANRTAEKALSLAKHVPSFARVTGSGLNDIPDTSFDLIINASSASLSGDSPNIDAAYMVNKPVCYDMVYSKEDTAFNLWCQQQGASMTLDGLGMLVEQAAQSFYLWRGIMPDTQPVRQALRMSLSQA